MGSFNTLVMPCECGGNVEFQSKAGRCDFQRYDVHHVPDVIAVDLRDEKETCVKCGTEYILDVQVIKALQLVRV